MFFKSTAFLVAIFIMGIATMYQHRVRRPTRILKIRLPQAAKEQLQARLETEPLPSYKKDIHIFQTKVTAIVKQVIEEHDLHEILDALAVNYGEHSALLIQNLPVDRNVGKIPSDGRREVDKDTQVAEALMTAFGVLAGAEPVGYKFELGLSHPIVHQGFPRSNGTAFNSLKEQQLHREMSYLPLKWVPDILAICNIRPGYDKDVGTKLIDVREVVSALSQKTKQVLRQPHFCVRAPPWVSSSMKQMPTSARPLLTGPKLAPSLALHVNWTNVEAMDKIGEEALADLFATITKLDARGHVSKVVSQPGDLLLFNNLRNLHARSAYHDFRGDGFDRIVFRSYFSKKIKGYYVSPRHIKQERF